MRDRHAVAVDPGTAAPVLDYLRQHNLELSAILVTHHHDDHIGGVADLLSHTEVPVHAPRNEIFPFPHIPAGEGDRISLGEWGITLSVLDIPGHTAGHVAYYGGNFLLCGDTLFGCGCGRIFDGNANQLHSSLQRIATLPDSTRIYSAHEYTLNNIRFARMIDPDNQSLIQREACDEGKVAEGLPTLPSTLLMEKNTNPFLRCGTPAIRLAATRINPEAAESEEMVFAIIREMKNHF